VTRPTAKPLFGIPFAIKDNIDCAGYATTAACPAWSYEAEQSAFVVDLLIKAGAIPVGKTNLDQFATGLVGVRSPYGAPGNAFDAAISPAAAAAAPAVAVAKGLVQLRARHRHGRLGACACIVQQPRRPQAHARRAELQRRRAGVQVPGLRLHLRADRRRRRRPVFNLTAVFDAARRAGPQAAACGAR